MKQYHSHYIICLELAAHLQGCNHKKRKDNYRKISGLGSKKKSVFVEKLGAYSSRPTSSGGFGKAPHIELRHGLHLGHNLAI